MIGKIFAGIILGPIVAILGAFVFALTIASPDGNANATMTGQALWIVWAIAIVIAVLSPTAGKACRRLFLVSALLSLALPIASAIFSGNSTAASTEAGSAAFTAGTAIGGGLITLMSGFLGFFLGAIFLVLAFFTGRDKQVVVVRESEEKSN